MLVYRLSLYDVHCIHNSRDQQSMHIEVIGHLFLNFKYYELNLEVFQEILLNIYI